MTELFASNITDTISNLFQLCRKKNIRLVTAESCTGGLISAALTGVSGSSDIVECGYVTYSNHAKITLLNVCEETISIKGAVSGEVAAQMARGALTSHKKELIGTHKYIAIAVTGIAGPTGGTAEKPVGTVWISCASLVDDGISCHTEHHVFDGGRTEIRLQTLTTALNIMQEKAKQL